MSRQKVEFRSYGAPTNGYVVQVMTVHGKTRLDLHIHTVFVATTEGRWHACDIGRRMVKAAAPYEHVVSETRCLGRLESSAIVARQESTGRSRLGRLL